MMKRLAPLFLLLATLPAFAGSANVTYKLSDFGQTTLTNATITLTPLSAYGTSGTNILLPPPITKQCNTNGVAVFSNLVNGFSYRAQARTFNGSVLYAFTNSFPTNATGEISAADYLTVLTNMVNDGTSAYSRSQSDARYPTFAAVTNIAQSVGGSGSTNVNWNNITNAPNVVTNYQETPVFTSAIKITNSAGTVVTFGLSSSQILMSVLGDGGLGAFALSTNGRVLFGGNLVYTNGVHYGDGSGLTNVSADFLTPALAGSLATIFYANSNPSNYVTASITNGLGLSAAQTATLNAAVTTNSFLSVLYGNTNVCRPEDFGAKGDGVTDDSAAFQSAINYVWSSNGVSGVVRLSDKTYLIRSNLYVPYKKYSQDFSPWYLFGARNASSLTIEGSTFQQISAGSLVWKNLDTNGAVILTTLTNQSLFCSSPVDTSSLSFPLFNVTTPVFKNVKFLCPTNIVTSLKVLDLRYFANAVLENVVVYASGPISLFNAPPKESVGILLPEVNCSMQINCKNVSISGFSTGLISGEHSSLFNLLVSGCSVGVSVGQCTYPASFYSTEFENCTTNINLKAQSSAFFDMISIEVCKEVEPVWAWPWQTTVWDVHDSSGGTASLVIGSVVKSKSFTGKQTFLNEKISAGTLYQRNYFGYNDAFCANGALTDATVPQTIASPAFVFPSGINSLCVTNVSGSALKTRGVYIDEFSFTVAQPVLASGMSATLYSNSVAVYAVTAPAGTQSVSERTSLFFPSGTLLSLSLTNASGAVSNVFASWELKGGQ